MVSEGLVWESRVPGTSPTFNFIPGCGALDKSLSHSGHELSVKSLSWTGLVVVKLCSLQGTHCRWEVRGERKGQLMVGVTEQSSPFLCVRSGVV